MKKFAFILLLMLAATNTLRAQQLNLKNGEEFAIEMRNTETNTAKQTAIIDNGYTFQFKMLGSSAAENKLECTVLKFSIAESSRYSKLKFSSDSIRNVKDFSTTAVLTPLILLQKPFTVVLNPKGKLLRIEGTDELIKQAIAQWHIAASMVGYVKPSLDAFLQGALKGMFLQLPDQKIAYQSTWANDENKTTYIVTAIHGAYLDIVSVNPDKTSQSKYALNEVNGLVEDAVVSYKQTVNNLPELFKYTQKVIYGKNTTPPVDTAWINMAISFSFMSDAFKNKTNDSDPDKIMGYFKGHDELYKNDAYYNANKLSLIQHAKGDKWDLMYADVLVKTPNQYLAGRTSHLFNKMQHVGDKDADAAFDVIKYYYFEPSFNEWIQESYAQKFMDDDGSNDKYYRQYVKQNKLPETEVQKMVDEHSKELSIAYELLEKLNNDKVLPLQPKIKPLYLWVTTKAQTDNSKVLLDTYSKFMSMNDEYLKAGNGNRYALLTYKLLLKGNKTKQADNLLQHTIENLERYTADTLNTARFADKNMLAYAYFLKYQSISKIDSVKALGYLAKASQNSPAQKSEKAYASNYDRSFLKSKESYREDYINKLFASGESEAGLSIFADQINADPSKLEYMQNIYQTRFAGKSFKEFFVNKVMAKWATAPAFTLTGVEGEKHTLADYKGKWLIIDFWGTWCSPCRDEMPEVDKFNSDIKQGKYAGINLLSIACNDNLIDVKSYLKENKLGITVAMSDDQVSKKYKIRYYPSKVLVAPNGKMIETPSNSDWQAIVKKLNELYAAN